MAALEAAVRAGDVSAVVGAMFAGADPHAHVAGDVSDTCGTGHSGTGSALHLAAGHGKTEVVKLLVCCMAGLGCHTCSTATSSSRSGTSPTSKRRRVVGSTAVSSVLASPTSKSYTALHLAAMGGHTATAGALCDRGAGIDAEDDCGDTPLHRAASNGHTATATLLLDRGAAIEAKDNDGDTPLHYAALDGYTATATLLLDRGADPTATDNDGDTAWDMATNEGHAAAFGAELMARLAPAATALADFAGLSFRDNWTSSGKKGVDADKLHPVAAGRHHAPLPPLLLSARAAVHPCPWRPMFSKRTHTRISTRCRTGSARLPAKPHEGLLPSTLRATAVLVCLLPRSRCVCGAACTCT